MSDILKDNNITNINGKFFTHSGHILSPKEAKFIDCYMESGNGTQAYNEAYGEKSSARQLAI